MFDCEEVSEGDTLRCTDGDGCCSITGVDYEAIQYPGSTGEQLYVKPSCHDQYGDYVRVPRLNPVRFELIRKSGPW